MFRVSVMYPYAEGARFDFDYYLNTHMPLVKATYGKFGLIKTGVDKGITSGLGKPPPFIAVGYLYFADAAAWERVLKEGGTAPRDDIPNFTDIAPIRQGSEVLDG